MSARLPVVGFLALVGAFGLFLTGQWLLTKLDSGAPVDIAEWPLVAIGVLLAAMPAAAVVGLWLGRGWGIRLGRYVAGLAAIVGGLALVYAMMLLTMGVAWNLLLGGAVLLVGGIASVRGLRSARW